jgi:hypothetical protein
MTKAAALHAWLNEFLTMYPVTAVPDDVTYPYGTYSIPFDSLDGGTVNGAITLWDYTNSEAMPNARAQEMADRIGTGGVIIACDGGYMWLTRGTPWSQAVNDEVSPDSKGRRLAVNIQYFTED